jgi:hypothetical protein
MALSSYGELSVFDASVSPSGRRWPLTWRAVGRYLAQLHLEWSRAVRAVFYPLLQRSTKRFLATIPADERTFFCSPNVILFTTEGPRRLTLTDALRQPLVQSVVLLGPFCLLLEKHR